MLKYAFKNLIKLLSKYLETYAKYAKYLSGGSDFRSMLWSQGKLWFTKFSTRMDELLYFFENFVSV